MRSTSCTVPGVVEAEIILQRLRAAGFSSKDISILSPTLDSQDSQKTAKVGIETQANLIEGVGAGAGAGGVLGGILAWLVGVGSLAIPGVGPLLAAGPLMAVLGGTALGAAVGGCAGIFAGLGLPEYEAKIYEHKLKEGWTLVSVNTREEDLEKREHIKEIFTNAGAINVSDINLNLNSKLQSQVNPGEFFTTPKTFEGSEKQGTKTI